MLKLRHRAGLTQLDLAQMTGLSVSAVSRVETTGACRMRTALALLDAFGPLEGDTLVEVAAAMHIAPHALAKKLDDYIARHGHRVPGPYAAVVSKPARSTDTIAPTDVLDDIRESHGTEGLRGALAAMEAMTERLREMLDENEKPDDGLTLVDRQQRSADGAAYVEETRRTFPTSKPAAAPTPAQLLGKALAKRATKKKA